MLQIRITNSDGSNPIILDRAENKSYSKEVNLGNESIQFDIAKNSDKADILNPETTGYKMFWEAWDTAQNVRLNRGPITSIEENGPNWKVTGAGRSALLNDFRKSLATFYANIDSVFDGLRYEDVASQPRASTIIYNADSADLVGGITVQEKWHGISSKTKDNAIDDDFGYNRRAGETTEHASTYFTTNSYWAGQSKNDNLVVDLGGVYDLTKVAVGFPWWGGPQKLNNRTYDWALDYALPDTTSPPIVYRNRGISNWTELFNSGDDNKIVTNWNTPFKVFIGTTVSGTSVDYNTYYVRQDIPGPLEARYLRVRIRDVHAWFGNVYDNVGPHDGWIFQCSNSYTAGDDPFFASTSEGLMHGKTIDERVLEPSNDCYASVVEVGAYQEIIPRDDIKPLALQRIDDNNLQITYYHTPDNSETTTTSAGFRKFEPGGFFRKIHFEYSGANTTYTKFFDTDCNHCYPDGFNFGIMDQNNSLLLASDSSFDSSGGLNCPAYTSSILMKGSPTATVTYVDSWPAVTAPLSYGGSYSYSEIAGDYATCHFRGQSFKWYATVPWNKTGATVKIEIRHKSAPNFTTEWATNTWSSWSTLEASLTLGNNLDAEAVYEIPFESGILQPDTVYEIKITNLDGNYCSIDSFEGFWSASLTTYNEDSTRVFLNDVTRFNQIYDKRFSGGSMYKITKQARISFTILGDRVIIYGAKGNNAGVISIGMLRLGFTGNDYDNPADKINIPGSGADRVLQINLNTGKRGNEITQAILFDSNDYFPDGLPWDRYTVFVHYNNADITKYNTVDTSEQDSFVPRCSDCNTPTGDTIQVNRPVYFDGFAAHEMLGLSLSFINETHLNIAKSVIEALQIEGDVTEDGLLITPRIGQDSNEVIREGQNVTVDYSVVNDITQMASILISNGSDIDGLPLFTITEDKSTREDLGRTIMRQEDFRDIADYFQLVGVSRTSLRKRRKPEKRITVTTSDDKGLDYGDSYILFTKKMGPIRVRINTKTRQETQSGGTTYVLECIRWPQII